MLSAGLFVVAVGALTGKVIHCPEEFFVSTVVNDVVGNSRRIAVAFSTDGVTTQNSRLDLVPPAAFLVEVFPLFACVIFALLWSFLLVG